MTTRRAWHPLRARRAFTLIELLVAIGIMAILGAITTVAVKAISEDARLATGRNTVTALLSQARSQAMRRNNVVVVAFRASLIGEDEQVIEAVTAEYSGRSFAVDLGACGPRPSIVDLFAPIAGVPYRQLPRGVNIAAPMYGKLPERPESQLWVAGSNFRAMRGSNPEAAGAVIAVMYGPDGTVLRSNARSGSVFVFVDFDNNGFQAQGPSDNFDYFNGYPSQTYCDFGYGCQFFECQAQSRDEPYLTLAPYLAVFDEASARSQLDASQWSNAVLKTQDLSDYINRNATRLFFNRTTGVVMTTEER